MLNMKKFSRKPQSGMTLIEVMVAILIFSIGLLGFVGLQARAIQISTGAEDSNRAALLANEVSALMQLKQTVSLPTADVTAWQTRVSTATGSGLPGGSGTITAGATANTATVTISWTERNAASAPAHQYVTQVVIPQ
jgi:type IV pilus assembly protein PilV